LIQSGHRRLRWNSAQLRQKGCSLLFASFSFAMENGWTVTAGGTNLTDEQYLLSGYADRASASAVTGACSRPRKWFLRIRK
jgi:iron complex outermembrane receptor protein